MRPHLSFIGTNPHGTRVVQKIVDHLTNEGLAKSYMMMLNPCVVLFIKDMNGNHIIHKFIQSIDEVYHRFIYENIATNIVEISNDKNGCCVLQKIIETAVPQMKVYQPII